MCNENTFIACVKTSFICLTLSSLCLTKAFIYTMYVWCVKCTRLFIYLKGDRCTPFTTSGKVFLKYGKLVLLHPVCVCVCVCVFIWVCVHVWWKKRKRHSAVREAAKKSRSVTVRHLKLWTSNTLTSCLYANPTQVSHFKEACSSLPGRVCCKTNTVFLYTSDN